MAILKNKSDEVVKLVQSFYKDVGEKLNSGIQGEPEDQLRGPFEKLIRGVGDVLGKKIVPTGETLLTGRIGQPDYAISVDGLLAGYVELKAPNKGASPENYRGHDAAQWERFKGIPNILYCDGSEWAIFRSGISVGNTLRLPSITIPKRKLVFDDKDIESLYQLLLIFFTWNPIPPSTAHELAEEIAPLCGLLRSEVIEALLDSTSSLVRLASDWRNLLFPNADDAQFADAYAQTITFALLLARANGANVLSMEDAEKKIGAKNTLLAKALQVLTDGAVVSEIKTALNLLQRYIAAIEPEIFAAGEDDPWLYFYEDFLNTYDPQLRKKAGAYYTPLEVVRAQVNLVGLILTEKFNKVFGFAEPDVITLDPAVGTGTYLLGVIEHALNKVKREEGDGAVSGRASNLLRNLKGFENMTGPYAVAELRLTQALLKHNADFSEPLGICLTDTLESPFTKPTVMGLFYEDMAVEHKRALKIKDEMPVLVCIGNPPYLRNEASTDLNRSNTGGWVRFGESDKSINGILNDFIKPVKDVGKGGTLKNLYNLYVYFWRWAIWKVFENKTALGPGIVSFITASSYLRGDAFLGMRQHLRTLCDEIWIIDLGGEGRGARKEENVFEMVRTPVAIAIAIRYKKDSKKNVAKVMYSRIEGSREEKLMILGGLNNFSDLKWVECESDLTSSFVPKQKGVYSEWPLLTDIMPWQYSGVQVKRIWPIAPDIQTLKDRWEMLLASSDRQATFQKKTRDRSVDKTYPDIFDKKKRLAAIATLPKNAPHLKIYQYGYRSFDTQFIIADERLISRSRAPLWQNHSEKQIYFTSLFTNPLGSGPAITVTRYIPDLDHFRGSYGAKGTIPLWRDSLASNANISPGLLDFLEEELGIPILPEDMAGYIYGILGCDYYTEHFKNELESTEIRIPITRNSSLFTEIKNLGISLINLHTTINTATSVTPGSAKCTIAVPIDPNKYPNEYSYDIATQTLHVGDGEFKYIAPAVWNFQVSGLSVVDSWLGYRMSERRGRSTSVLDNIHPERWTPEFTTQLLRLLWCIEKTLEIYAIQAKKIDEVLSGDLFMTDELPTVPSEARLISGEENDSENIDMFAE